MQVMIVTAFWPPLLSKVFYHFPHMGLHTVFFMVATYKSNHSPMLASEFQPFPVGKGYGVIFGPIF